MKGKENSNIAKVRKRPFKINWTEEEDRILFSMAEQNKRKSWKSISKMLNNKTPSQCFYRFHVKNSLIDKKNWTIDEDRIIKEFVKANGNKWDELAKILSHRTSKKIQERYLNKLDDNLIHSKFSAEEDEKIIALYLKYGSKWSFISRFFRGRTPDMIKSRFYSSLQKKISYTKENYNEIQLLHEKEISKYQKFSENSNSFGEEVKQEKNKSLNSRKQKRTQLKNKIKNQMIKADNPKSEQNSILNPSSILVDFKNQFRNEDNNNNTLTDISFEGDSEKNPNSNSNYLTNPNSCPFNKKMIAIAHQTNDFGEKSFIEFLSEDEDLNQNEFKDSEITNNDYIHNYSNFLNYNNNNHNNNANYFYCDKRNNLNYHNNSNQFEFTSYIQKQIHENIFEALND